MTSHLDSFDWGEVSLAKNLRSVCICVLCADMCPVCHNLAGPKGLRGIMCYSNTEK